MAPLGSFKQMATAWSTIDPACASDIDDMTLMAATDVTRGTNQLSHQVSSKFQKYASAIVQEGIDDAYRAIYSVPVANFGDNGTGTMSRGEYEVRYRQRMVGTAAVDAMAYTNTTTPTGNSITAESLEAELNNFAWRADHLNVKSPWGPQPSVADLQLRTMQVPYCALRVPRPMKMTWQWRDEGMSFEDAVPVEVDEFRSQRRVRVNGKTMYEFDFFVLDANRFSDNNPYVEKCMAKLGFRRMRSLDKDESLETWWVKDEKVKIEVERIQVREIIKAKQVAIINKKAALGKAHSPQELKARELLKRWVGEKEFRRYLKFGYVVVSAHGFVWRVPGERSSVTRVEQYFKNTLLNKYCVHFENSNIPPTDACVMRLTLLQAGIDKIAQHSNSYKVDNGLIIKPKAPSAIIIPTSKEVYDTLKRTRERLAA